MRTMSLPYPANKIENLIYFEAIDKTRKTGV
jgi:hypothetical protein